MKAVRVLVVALSMPWICVAQSARQIAQTAFKSVVLLETDDSQGQPVSLGTGFFIADGIIATNAHVIQGAVSGTAKLIGTGRKVPIQGTVAVDRRIDLALLKVASSAPALSLGRDAKPAVGDKVYVVGNPLGLEGTFSEGIVSSIRSVDSDSILQMTAPISPGSSGGPVMDDSGIVIGVAEATFENGQNLNLAVPVEYLSKLWAANSRHLTVSALSQQTMISSTPSVVDQIGERTEAGVNITDFKLYHVGYETSSGGFEMRIHNKLPVSISGIKLRIIYRDNSNAIMDFEDFVYDDAIPSGLTKTLERHNSEEAGRACEYYDSRDANGSPLSPPIDDGVKHMEPRVEIRVLGFNTDE